MPKIIEEEQQLFLDKLHFQGYKSISDLKVNLVHGINILIGKNGAGKSNFLELVYRVMRGHYRESNLPYKFARLELISSDNHKFDFEIKRIIQKPSSEIERITSRVSVNEKLIIDNNLTLDNFNRDNYPKSIEFNNNIIPIGRNIRNTFLRLGYYTFRPLYLKFNIPEKLDCIAIPATIKIPLSVEELWEYSIGSLNFVNTLFYKLEFEKVGENSNRAKTITKAFLLKHLKIDDEIIENLNLYSPIQGVRFSENINIYTDEKSITVENLKLEFKLNKNWLPWSHISDGTKRLFYLISEITHYENGLILIEEPELGIHPHQFNLVMTFLKEQSENKQIILSTHSPKALDHLNEKELNNIIVATYSSNLGTQIKHLSTSQKNKALAYTKEVGFLSDYWLLSNLE